MGTKLYWIHALTPVHVGSGQGVGFIDLPVMREKTTNWPLIPGSAVKGVTRAHWEDKIGKGAELDRAFGKVGTADEDLSYSGALVFTDAHMVCLAVRSLYGTFAWITCPMALRRLARDTRSAGTQAEPGIPTSPGDEMILVPDDSSVLKDDKNRVFFNDLDLSAQTNDPVKQWAERLARRLFSGEEKDWQPEFIKRFAVVSDDSFNFFCETGTEVSPHVKIKPETKTVQTGALWFQESIPAESILSGMVWCDWVFSGNKDERLSKTRMDEERKRLLTKFCLPETILQIGGNATTGKGRVRCLFTGGGDNDE